KITGVPRAKLIGTDFCDYFTNPELARAGYKQVFDLGMVNDYPLTVQHLDGRVIDVLYNASVYKDAQGKVLGVFAAARDVTHQNQISNELRLKTQILENQKVALESLNVIAQSANHAKSDFLANMSHEIRTPLGAILGYSELMSNPDQPKNETLNCAYRIQRKIEILTELIDEILDLSKIEAGKLEVERIEFELLPELRETFVLLQERAQVKGLSFEVTFEGEIPQVISGCPRRVRQVLLNLVGNAIKFTAEGGVRIGAKVIPSVGSTANPSLSFVIRDSGCGLDLTQQQRLFQPFGQADSSVTRKYGGSGLGLVLSRHLAEALGGDVALLSSEVGHGSTFTFTLDPGPLTGVPMHEGLLKVDLKPINETPKNVFVANSRLKDLRILLVDDALDIQTLMRCFLEASSATVEIANNGAEAVRMGLEHHYDAVLMDMQMPILDGNEATRQLRAGGCTVPILALTANAMRGEREACIASGCDDYLTKPVRANTLVDAIEKIVGNSVPGSACVATQSELCDDPFVGPLVREFILALPARFAALCDAQQRLAWAEVSGLAHQLAGSAGAYGFPEMGRVAAKIEAQAKSNVDLPALTRSIAMFRTLCDGAVRGISPDHAPSS
ncbi:MAG: response regulator, partial [Oligoflexus sp.]|nr:response regulator [Oligoflexus sp.]